MKRRWFSLVFAASVSWAAESEIEFSGVMGGRADTRVLLATKSQSAWVVVGKTFSGYTVIRYDPKTDVLTVQKDGRDVQLRLKESRVKEGAQELAPAVHKAILNNLRQLAAAADQYYLENGKNRTTFDDLVGLEPKKYIKTMTPQEGENYRAITLEAGKPIEVRTATGHVVSYSN